MRMVSIDASKTDGRFFSKAGQQALEQMKEFALPNVKEWIFNYLERYFLSDRFQDMRSMDRVYKKEWMPVQFRESEKPVFAITPSHDVYNKWVLIIQWMNGIKKQIKWNVETAEKYYNKYASDLRHKELIKIICYYDDGYQWVSLLDKNALERESAIMQHCIAREDTPHLEDMLSGKYVFLSLRKNDKPYVTMKYNPKSRIITDLVGKQNTYPDKKYYEYIIDVVNKLGLRPSQMVIIPFNKAHYNEEANKWVLEEE